VVAANGGSDLIYLPDGGKGLAKKTGCSVIALIGRVLSETLPNGALPVVTGRVLASDPAPNGLATMINTQMVGDTRYYDAAGFPGRTVGLSLDVLPGATQ
jgi:hypothetical protein